jgi:PilZ domain
MRIGMSTSKDKDVATLRRETRVPMEVGVELSGHARVPGSEATFTQNVSGRGARVVSVRRWKTNDHLVITMRTGSFQCVARVAYCQPVPHAGYAVGIEFLAPRGQWVVSDGLQAS